jgi:hypothetical protein
MRKGLLLLAWLLAVVPCAAQDRSNLIVARSTIPGTCDDGNTIVLTAQVGDFASGSVLVCSSNTFVPMLPTALIVSGASLPATCKVGALFTVTPTGALWTCPIANMFVPVAATLIPAKTVTGLANNVFTDVLMVSVPNAASGAIIEVVIAASLGTGGAVGQYEATTGRTLLIAITRTPGLATDMTITTMANPGMDARVVGATTIAIATQLSAVTGANTATQTFTLQLRVTRGAGTSTNHIASLRTSITSPTLTNITVQ